MKAPIFFIMLLAAVYAVTAATEAAQASDVADGLYQVTLDEAGNTKTEFTPWEHCGPGSGNVNEADEANRCLIDGFPAGPNVYLDKNHWTYCVRGNAVSYICPRQNGYKPKEAIKSTWAYVKRTCGPSIFGHAQVSSGVGDWIAGYALKTDHFCTNKFKVGS
ncbi:uncharacterized protein VP01_4466g1 [Puccinia sorghi]|uniref:Uncharacterized protein n=1 Tax=Puccinia sorghi TaxID=27349 RepID=A0A0L6UPB4_9BASI|nr:uncharacterized protein VP01_4466g1 [Puccinia sorghi]